MILGVFTFCDMLVLLFDCNWKNKAVSTGPGCSGVQSFPNIKQYVQLWPVTYSILWLVSNEVEYLVQQRRSVGGTGTGDIQDTEM